MWSCHSVCLFMANFRSSFIFICWLYRGRVELTGVNIEDESRNLQYVSLC